MYMQAEGTVRLKRHKKGPESLLGSSDFALFPSFNQCLDVKPCINIRSCCRSKPFIFYVIDVMISQEVLGRCDIDVITIALGLKAAIGRDHECAVSFSLCRGEKLQKQGTFGEFGSS